jgi:cystathionine beta-lyase family protein involved in aluminum resistance
VIVIVVANYINVEQMLAIAGSPYDTLEEVIGIRGPSDSNINIGSLKDFGICYREVPVSYHYVVLYYNT